MNTPTPQEDSLRRRIHDLRAVRRVLLPDRDDSTVLSELTSIEAQLVKAEAELRAAPNPSVG